MNAGQLLKSKGWIEHPRQGEHPPWSKNGCESIPLSRAIEMEHAETARNFEQGIRNEWREMKAEMERKGATAQ